MKTKSKHKVASKMNPLFGKGISSVSKGNKTYAAQINNSKLLSSDASKYEDSIEGELESGEGWPPGVKKLFDTALKEGDKLTIKALLPYIPKEYANRFSVEIHRILNQK